MKTTRREFLGAAATLSASTLIPNAHAQETTMVTADKLPRWRGFNLLEKFTDRYNAPFEERDFEMMAEWGFDFVRLPLSYWCWSSPDDWRKMDKSRLKEIDQAVELGKRHGIHVNINFHRAPGYCVNPPDEPFNLWEDTEALEASTHHWRHFAERYKGIPNNEVSFDLLNEPARIDETVYVRVMTVWIDAIREIDPDRLIVVDGLSWGRDPVPGFANMNIAQSTRGYDPMRVSHHQANWINGSDTWGTPTWPLKEGDYVYDKERYRRERIDPWKALEAEGVGVHVGEWGAYNRTPHEVALAWMTDLLDLWEQAGWGWAMWNFRGAFGVLDSGRKDVEYESYNGHQLDRKMLELIRAH